VAYSHNQQLAIHNLATKTITYPRKIGTMPRWSPSGDRIAFVSQQRVWVTNPDGTGLRAVTPDSVSVGEYPGLDWSADGQ
jgi:Tol biopolymer transport system component